MKNMREVKTHAIISLRECLLKPVRIKLIPIKKKVLSELSTVADKEKDSWGNCPDQ